jgi:hypothetical protein
MSWRRSRRARRGAWACSWSLDALLPAAPLAEIGARDGTLHSYTLFTGDAPRSIRGEMRSSQVLGSR